LASCFFRAICLLNRACRANEIIKKENKVRPINFNLLPEFEFTATFMCLPQNLEGALVRFPETLERIESSLMFCSKLTYCDPKQDRRAGMKAGRYFRAALAEYVSIEEAFNRERPSDTSEFNLDSTENPLPHILEQLRHLQVHLTTSEMSDRRVSLWLKNVPGSKPVDIRIWTISDLTDSQLTSLHAFKNEKHYTATQATEMVNWLNARQTDFGIHDLVHRGLVEIAERIAAIYLPQAQAAFQ
jgi:hypothetical protein